jgi:hypothetical protein
MVSLNTNESSSSRQLVSINDTLSRQIEKLEAVRTGLYYY